MTVTLSEADVAEVLKYEILIPAMEKALLAFSAGRVIQPVRNMLTIEDGKRFLGIMPAVAEEGMGAKLVCFYPKNSGSPLPTHLAMIMLLEPETGQPLEGPVRARVLGQRPGGEPGRARRRADERPRRLLPYLGRAVRVLRGVRH